MSRILQLGDFGNMFHLIFYIIIIHGIAKTNSFRHSLRQKGKFTLLNCKNIDSDDVAHNKGLLSGITDLKNAEYYSDKVVIKSSYQLLKDESRIFNICLNNVDGNTTKLDENLKSMREKAEQFIMSDEVWNRKDLMISFENIIGYKGKFVCLLAGKNTGKSLILKNLEKRYPTKVFLVDLRVHPNILIGLVTTLRDRKYLDITDKAKRILFPMVANFIKRYTVIKDIFKDDEFQKYLDIAFKKSDPEALPSLINDLVNGLGGITLVIDEANIALTIKESTPNSQIKETEEALALFTALTKQMSKLNVILVSSEHAFPFRLRDPKLSFNLENFNGYIYAGEVPPKDMYELLTTKFGVKSNLAVALIDIYGGHIYDVYQALIRLYEDKDGFWLMESTLSDNVRRCLKWKGEKEGDKERMLDALRQLATTGFYPIDEPIDPLAKGISENNVGGVVKFSAKVIGLRTGVWKTTKFENGIVPSKQSMRLAIAKVLEE